MYPSFWMIGWYAKALEGRPSGHVLPDPCLQTKQSAFLPVRPNLTFPDITAL